MQVWYQRLPIAALASVSCFLWVDNDVDASNVDMTVIAIALATCRMEDIHE